MNVSSAKVKLYLQGGDLGVLEVLGQLVDELLSRMKAFQETVDVVKKQTDVPGEIRDVQEKRSEFGDTVDALTEQTN